MKKNRLLFILLVCAVMCGCSDDRGNKEQQEQTQQEKTDDGEEAGTGKDSGERATGTGKDDGEGATETGKDNGEGATGTGKDNGEGATGTGKDNGEGAIGTGKNDREEAQVNGESDSQPAAEATRLAKEEVLAARERVLEGMSEEEAGRLKENIKVANTKMEWGYLYDDIFTKLEDPESLYWNYFDEKGDIQIGWSYEGGYLEMKAIMEEEDLSQEEFYSQYGTPVMAYNRFDANNFVELLEEMKGFVENQELQDDLQQIIDETNLAVQTHEMEHAYKIYQLLHDMDYYLFRYGLEDVGKYVKDTSLLSRYYGVLSVYK